MWSELPFCYNYIESWPKNLNLATLDMTFVTSLEIGGKKCIDDLSYNQDDCRYEYIHQVSKLLSMSCLR